METIFNVLTTKEIFELRKQGQTELAYESARQLYAVDKSPYATSAMFWTAVDMLKLRANEDCMNEANKIFLALERLLAKAEDENGWKHDAMKKCNILLHRGETRKTLVNEGPKHLQMGIWGEELATAYLREKGYIILERDWHSKHRDIDIIAQKGEYIIFVEVKTRQNDIFADPLSAVDYRKIKNLSLAINHYIKYRKVDKRWRFDVITIVGKMGCDSPIIKHVENFSIL
jgi:uncharacterized protein (TIGR00252 family)